MATNCRVVFFGTPDFAVPTLRTLLGVAHVEVAGVVTQPDRPAGRGQRMQFSPVKQAALDAGLPVIQPEKTHTSPAFEQIAVWQPDFLVVVAFGQILRQKMLDLPRIAPVNVHGSLLPRWRGAAPIQAAIRAGDLTTGITTMWMDAGMDTGPILLQASLPILPEDTGQTMHDKLSLVGASLLVHTLDWLLSGSIQPRPQPNDPSLVTLAPVLKKEDGLIDWRTPAAEIDRHVRAFTPWPGTYTVWQGRRLKILAGRPLALGVPVTPGMVLDLRARALPRAPVFVIGTARGVYVPTRLQLEGRAPVDAAAFLNGAPDFVGALLGR